MCTLGLIGVHNVKNLVSHYIELLQCILLGAMFFGKPIYVAIAQRREVRRAQLEQQYAQRIAGMPGPPGAMVPSPYPPMYFAAPPGVVPPLPQRQGIMYPVSIRPGWRPGVPPGRPGFQPMPALPVVLHTFNC